jgi:hypothetical protein
MQKVKVTKWGIYSGSYMHSQWYYCTSCTQPYDEKEIPSPGKPHYFKRMEVDEFGKPIESK